MKPKGNTLHYLGFKDLNFSQVIENLKKSTAKPLLLWVHLTCNKCLLLARPNRTLEMKDLNGIENNLLTTIITIMVLWLILLFSTVYSFLRGSPSSSFVPCLRIFWLGWHRLREFFYVSCF